MDYGLVLPAMGDGSTREGLEAAGELAERHGFGDVWGTDHLLVPRSAADDYGRIYEILTTLAWLAGRFRRVRVGASVVIAPMRNAVLLAKELATLDDLSGGRLIVGLGAGWNAAEFGNVGMAGRFHLRGAYLEETVALLRHLWSGSSEPFEGRFHRIEDFVFGPLPRQGAGLPIWIGGRNEKALRRVGRIADAYHASATSPESFAERVPVIRSAAEEAGRGMPRLSGRVRVELGGPEPAGYYAMHGSPEQVAGEIRKFAGVGVTHLAVAFPESDPEGLARSVERFVLEVRPLV
ncbi:MAG TPA: TIGR03619 family F420-dependent LLM class oxidoreductase [Candidatus Limnocylindrales bacterium]|nr:TIGR03619 family F420-dependent LLM class oxidoreductase [Candidatus Limnocylindrales bacterium]